MIFWNEKIKEEVLLIGYLRFNEIVSSCFYETKDPDSLFLDLVNDKRYIG